MWFFVSSRSERICCSSSSPRHARQDICPCMEDVDHETAHSVTVHFMQFLILCLHTPVAHALISSCETLTVLSALHLAVLSLSSWLTARNWLQSNSGLTHGVMWIGHDRIAGWVDRRHGATSSCCQSSHCRDAGRKLEIPAATFHSRLHFIMAGKPSACQAGGSRGSC